jgi:hypothetical protein
MNTEKLNRTIWANPETLGLSEDEMTIINFLHDRTGLSCAECLLELIRMDWDLYQAFINIENAKESRELKAAVLKQSEEAAQ